MEINEKALARFAAQLQAEERSPATVEKYCREAARFAGWLDGRSVDRALALAYKAALAESRAPAGVNGAVAALNRLFDILGVAGCRLKAVKVQRRIFRDEEKELTEFLNTWLALLPKADRILFMRRYWDGEAVKDLAKEYRIMPRDMAKRMYRLRQSLKSALEKEDYSL